MTPPDKPGDRLAREQERERKSAEATLEFYQRLVADPSTRPGTRVEAQAWLDWHRVRTDAALAQAERVRPEIVATIEARQAEDARAAKPAATRRKGGRRP